MTCSTCEHWAAISDGQYRARIQKMSDSPDSPHVCPTCGRTDWITTRAFIRPARERARIITLMAWVAICFALTALALMLVVARARAELCLPKIDNGIALKGGYRWQWREVDGRKCWFYSNRLLLQEDLIWSYKSHDFDSDVNVLGRRFYFPDPDENGLLRPREPE